MFGIGFCFPALAALIALGQPIAFALGTAGVLVFLVGGLPFPAIASAAYSVLDNSAWASIPLFVIMGEVLLRAGIARDMYRAIHAWTQHIPGGLSVATVLTSALFAAVCGTSVGTVAALAAVTVPEMIARGYQRPFAYGCMATSGTLGILIPPSITMIIYGMVTNESIPKLFIAGLIPGLLLTALLSFYCVFYALRYQRETVLPKLSLRERLAETKHAIWGIGLIVTVIGGLYSGIVTVTEASALGAVLSLLVAKFIYRKLDRESLHHTLRNSLLATSMILTIVVFASTFGTGLDMLHVPQDISDSISSLQLAPWLVVVTFMLILFFLGQFLDVGSIMLITLPIFHPTIVNLGFSPLWFAVLMTMNMEVATITPPVGLNVYVLHGAIPDSKLSEILKGSVPFVVVILFAMLIVAAIPQLSTWLPSRM